MCAVVLLKWATFPQGVFAWTTVNFLLHNLDPDKPDATTAGIMDLGGGSTQIVFEPSPGSLAGIAVDDVAELSVGGARKRRIFVHSYLGLGLNQAVKRLQAAEGDLCGKRSLEPGRVPPSPSAHITATTTLSRGRLPGLYLLIRRFVRFCSILLRAGGGAL
jgi:hypothetical protein